MKRFFVRVACGVTVLGAAAFAQTADLTHAPGIEFLKNPIPVEDSQAASESEMKPYEEQIFGTELKFKMIPIKGGKFLMGSPESEEGRADEEGPQIEVEVEPFWIEEHEVTWGEFMQFAYKILRESRKSKADGEKNVNERTADALAAPTPAYDITSLSYGNSSKPNFPASGMTNYSAQSYCKWLTAVTGRYYRLPTEAEWEYACRAGTKTAFSSGDDVSQVDDYAWHLDNADGSYHQVMTKKPNPWGLYDMHGNVSEWVLGRNTENLYQQYKDGKIKTPFYMPETIKMMTVSKGRDEIARGGSCDQFPDECRSASRNITTEDWKLQDPQFPKSIWWVTEAPYVGFRVLRPLNPPKTAEECKLYEPVPEVADDYKRVNQRD
ncbi:MAG: formylglycine-generating enzyme family protein [Planctomycetaceae bacterium]|jgi:formylglycine-generating enzyme required for sulfatase activity|nr:formylglycine-generating enzyme family protein [Planctomycetaceae bacterium]